MKDCHSLPNPPFSVSSSMATSTTNLSLLQTFSSLRLFSSYYPQYAPNLSCYSRFRSTVHLSAISSKSYRNTIKPRSLIVVAAVKTLSETGLLAVPLTSEEFNEKLPSESGVYAVYDKNDELQFIGISRNIAASLLAHLKSVPELCGSVKVRIFYQTGTTREVFNFKIEKIGDLA